MSIKINLWFLSCYLLTGSLSAQKNNYELTGYLQGLQDNEKVTAFILDPSGHYFDKRDSTYAHGGEFKLQGIVPEGPREYIVAFDQHAWSLEIFINNGEKITVRSNEDLSAYPHSSINYCVTISNSAFQNSWAMLKPSYHLYLMSVGNLKRYAQQLVDSIGFDGPKLDQIFGSLQQIHKAFALEFFTKDPHQNDPEETGSYALWGYRVDVTSNHASFLVDGYNQLSPEMKNSFYGKNLKEYTKLCVGQPFPDFNLPTAQGGQLALKDIVDKSRVTLVHFWGANSYMKKEMQDELKVMYRKYHDKGLNIIGFYSDKYADEWKDIVQKEQYPWYNVSDSKGKEGMAANTYHEYIAPGQTIPNTTNVLIDATGKILAWDVMGAELQWYLWKACEQKTSN